MNIRFFGGKTLSMAENDQISNDEVWIKDDKILYIGKAKPADFSWDREIDLKGNLLLPGFKNAHTHSAMTFLRSFADDLPLLDWLQKQVFPMEAKLNADDIYWLSRLAILEYLSSGMTANFDMYYHPEAVASASVDSGFRTV
ncbi:MAG: amidohydrolase family protein, partial [Oscillospiraceae bacterium]